MSNKYFKGAKISEGTFRRIVRSFANDRTATEASQEIGVSLRSVTPIFLRIRERIAEFGDVSLTASSIQVGTYRFGPRVIKGTRGRGAERKTIVLVLYGCDDRVFLESIPDETKATIWPLLESHLPMGSLILTNGMRTFDGLGEVGLWSHIRTKGAIPPFQEQHHRLGGAEIWRFWRGAQQDLKRFFGFPLGTRRLHLKERAFRHNHRNEDLYPVLLKLIREHPLDKSTLIQPESGTVTIRDLHFF